MEVAGADGTIMLLGGRDVRVRPFPSLHPYLSLREIDDRWIGATSESEQVHSTQKRQRKARTRALVRRGCASLNIIQCGDVDMKYMQLFRRRATTRTWDCTIPAGG